MMEDSTLQRKTTILVVDDEDHIVRVVAFKLRAAGFEVIEAFDGEEAWTRLRDTEIDLVLTDQQMPVLDGIGLARRIAADDRFAGVPVVMLTARGFRLDPEEFAGTGIVEMLDKPFSPRVLLERVRANLDRRSSRREAA